MATTQIVHDNSGLNDSKSPKSDSSSGENSQGNLEEDVYEVEKIIGVSEDENGLLFKVRWLGYSPKWDTWEPYENLTSCREMTEKCIKEYKEKKRKKKLGLDPEIFSPEGSDSSSQVTPAPRKKKKLSTHYFVPSVAEEADTLKDKFWRDLEHGKIDVFRSGDMYSKVKVQGRPARPKSLSCNSKADKMCDSKVGLEDAEPKKKKIRLTKQQTGLSESNAAKLNRKRRLKSIKKAVKSNASKANSIINKEQNESVLNSEKKKKKGKKYYYVSESDEEADTLKDKFWRDLEQGKINVFKSGDMYSKVKGQGRCGRLSSTDEISTCSDDSRLQSGFKCVTSPSSPPTPYSTCSSSISSLPGSSSHDYNLNRLCLNSVSSSSSAEPCDQDIPEPGLANQQARVAGSEPWQTDVTDSDSLLSSASPCSSDSRSTDESLKPQLHSPTLVLGKRAMSSTHVKHENDPSLSTLHGVEPTIKQEAPCESPLKPSKNQKPSLDSPNGTPKRSSCDANLPADQIVPGDSFDTQSSPVKSCQSPLKSLSNSLIKAEANQMTATSAVSTKSMISDHIKRESEASPSPVRTNFTDMPGVFDMQDGDSAIEFDLEDIDSLINENSSSDPVEKILLTNVELRHGVKMNNYDYLRVAFQNPGKKYDLEQIDSQGNTLLMSAAQSGFDDVLELLVMHGANVDAVNDKGITPLLLAAEQGHACTVELLLILGAKLNHRQRSGETALHRAIKKGHKRVVQILLNNGANFSQAAGSPDETPLNCATGQVEISKLLTDHITHIKTEFESQVNITLNNTATIIDSLFPLQCCSLCESELFNVAFNHNLAPTEPGVGMLLFIAHARVGAQETKCRFYGPCATKSVFLNNVKLQPLTEDANFVMSFSPLHNGRNELTIETIKSEKSRAKLLVCAYKAKLIQSPAAS